MSRPAEFLFLQKKKQFFKKKKTILPQKAHENTENTQT